MEKWHKLFENYFFKNFTKIWTYRFLGILEFKIENKTKKKFRKNFFENKDSDLWKNFLLVHKTTLKKKGKKKENVNNLWGIMETKPVLLVDF